MTEKFLKWLVCSQKIDLVQGYFVLRPMPGDQIVQWAKNWEADFKK